MAGQAPGVVSGQIVDERLVGVVAGDAGDARVSGAAPATALFEAVGLEADGDDSDVGGQEHGYVGRGAVTGSAEVY